MKPAQTARERLIEAATRLVREQGFAATSVDQLCSAAGVTKGAFFHHFASKEAMGAALAEHWSRSTSAFFAAAPFNHFADPAERVLGYIDLRIALLSGQPAQFSCVAGTLVQEAFNSSELIREACHASIMGNARMLEADIAAALQECGGDPAEAAGLARHVQAVIQGAFILAKAHQPDQAADVAAGQLRHLRRYFELLLNQNNTGDSA